MSDDLKLPQVGELTLPQWRDWLVRYNAVLGERNARIEKLEAALRKLSNTCDCWAAVEECGKARELLERKDD